MTSMGADVAKLRALSRRFDTGASTLDDIRTTIDQLVRDVDWCGADAGRFRSDWNGPLTTKVKQARTTLATAAKDLARQADEQERTSSAGGEGQPGGGVGVGVGGVASTTCEPASAADTRKYILDHVDVDDFHKMELENWPDRSADEVREGLKNALENASDSEMAVIQSLLDRGMTDAQLTQLLKGGHVWIADESLYDTWRGLPDAGDRRLGSSHYGSEMSDPQFQIEGGLFGEALIGRVRGGTWIQLELFGDKDPRHLTTGYFQYSDTHENLGPWGQSEHTEANPIELGGRRPADPPVTMYGVPTVGDDEVGVPNHDTLYG